MKKAANKAITSALVHYACPVCCRLHDSQIISVKKAKGPQAQRIREMDGGVAGYTRHICQHCIDELAANGMIGGYYIVETDDTKTLDKNNPFRTGRVVMITAKHFTDLFTVETPLRCVFLDRQLFTKFFNNLKTIN